MRVSGDDLNARPVTRPCELLEAAPGQSVTQLSGKKANQYFMRELNLNHAETPRSRAGALKELCLF
jgi:hypothetical protein